MRKKDKYVRILTDAVSALNALENYYAEIEKNSRFLGVTYAQKEMKKVRAAKKKILT